MARTRTYEGLLREIERWEKTLKKGKEKVKKAEEILPKLYAEKANMDSPNFREQKERLG